MTSYRVQWTFTQQYVVPGPNHNKHTHAIAFNFAALQQSDNNIDWRFLETEAEVRVAIAGFVDWRDYFPVGADGKPGLKVGDFVAQDGGAVTEIPTVPVLTDATSLGETFAAEFNGQLVSLVGPEFLHVPTRELTPDDSSCALLQFLGWSSLPIPLGDQALGGAGYKFKAHVLLDQATTLLAPQFTLRNGAALAPALNGINQPKVEGRVNVSYKTNGNVDPKIVVELIVASPLSDALIKLVLAPLPIHWGQLQDTVLDCLSLCGDVLILNKTRANPAALVADNLPWHNSLSRLPDDDDPLWPKLLRRLLTLQLGIGLRADTMMRDGNRRSATIFDAATDGAVSTLAAAIGAMPHQAANPTYTRIDEYLTLASALDNVDSLGTCETIVGVMDNDDALAAYWRAVALGVATTPFTSSARAAAATEIKDILKREAPQNARAMVLRSLFTSHLMNVNITGKTLRVALLDATGQPTAQEIKAAIVLLCKSAASAILNAAATGAGWSAAQLSALMACSFNNKNSIANRIEVRIEALFPAPTAAVEVSDLAIGIQVPVDCSAFAYDLAVARSGLDGANATFHWFDAIEIDRIASPTPNTPPATPRECHWNDNTNVVTTLPHPVSRTALEPQTIAFGYDKPKRRLDAALAHKDNSASIDYVYRDTATKLPALGFGLTYKFGIANIDCAFGSHGLGQPTVHPAYRRFGAGLFFDPPPIEVTYLSDVAPKAPQLDFTDVENNYRRFGDPREDSLFNDLFGAGSSPNLSGAHSPLTLPDGSPIDKGSGRDHIVMICPNTGEWSGSSEQKIRVGRPTSTRKFIERWLETDAALADENKNPLTKGLERATARQLREFVETLDTTLTAASKPQDVANPAVSALLVQTFAVGRDGALRLIDTDAIALPDVWKPTAIGPLEVDENAIVFLEVMYDGASAKHGLIDPKQLKISASEGPPLIVIVTSLVEHRFVEGTKAGEKRFKSDMLKKYDDTYFIAAKSSFVIECTQTKEPTFTETDLKPTVAQERGVDIASVAFAVSAVAHPAGAYFESDFVVGFDRRRLPWRWNGLPNPVYPFALTGTVTAEKNQNMNKAWLAANYLNFSGEEPLMRKRIHPQRANQSWRLDEETLPATYGARLFAWQFYPVFRYDVWRKKKLQTPAWWAQLLVPGKLTNVASVAPMPLLKHVVPMTDAKQDADERLQRVRNGMWLILKESWMRTDPLWQKSGGLGEDIEVDVVPEEIWAVTGGSSSSTFRWRGALARIGENPIFGSNKNGETAYAPLMVGAPMALTFDQGINPKLVNTAFPVFPRQRRTTIKHEYLATAAAEEAEKVATTRFTKAAVEDSSRWTMAHIRTRRVILPESESRWPARNLIPLAIKTATTFELPLEDRLYQEQLPAEDILRTAFCVTLTLPAGHERFAYFDAVGATGVCLMIDGTPRPDTPFLRLDTTLARDDGDRSEVGNAEKQCWRLEFTPSRTASRDSDGTERFFVRWEVALRLHIFGRWQSVDRLADFDVSNWPAPPTGATLVPAEPTPLVFDGNKLNVFSALTDVEIRIDRLRVSQYTAPRWITLIPDLGTPSVPRLDYDQLVLAVGTDSTVTVKKTDGTTIALNLGSLSAVLLMWKLPTAGDTQQQTGGNPEWVGIGKYSSDSDSFSINKGGASFGVIALLQGAESLPADLDNKLMAALGFGPDASSSQNNNARFKADVEQRIVFLSPPIRFV